MGWIRWRAKWASGTDSWNFEYLDVPPEKMKVEAEYFTEDETNSIWYHNEMFRGIEWEIIEIPPINIIEEKIRTAEYDLRQAINKLYALKHDLTIAKNKKT